MKALWILKIECLELQGYRGVKPDFMKNKIKQYHEAIAEMEALQKQNDKLIKEVAYWKLSFNKEVEAQRVKATK